MLVEKKFLGSTRNKNKVKQQQQKPRAGSCSCPGSGNCEQQRHLVMIPGRDLAEHDGFTNHTRMLLDPAVLLVGPSDASYIYSRDGEAQGWKLSGLFPTTYNHFYERVPL